MSAIYLLLIMLSPTGEMVQKGYSQVTFESLPECQEFVDNIIYNMEEKVDSFAWNFDFTFKAVMSDGSATLGQCVRQEDA